LEEATSVLDFAFWLSLN